jgi:hypothetical protein
MTTFYPYRSRRRWASGGINQDQTWWVKCEAVGKARYEESPYLFANEWIAGNIAQFLRLPIPPFALLSKKSRGTAMFCSYNFRGDSTPADVKPDELYGKFPSECVGIFLFDCLVINCDRHRGNLKVDDPDKPTDFYIFDHERALFYIYKGEGIKRLNSRQNRLGVSDSAVSDPADEWHCLIECIDSAGLLSDWLRRIESIPDWFIDAICGEVLRLGITQTERDAVARFLKERRTNLASLVHANRQRFPKITKWPLFL